jgi:hypothetical protein
LPPIAAAAPPLRPPHSALLISATADEFAGDWPGTHGTVRVERHLGGMVFVGAARKNRDLATAR